MKVAAVQMVSGTEVAANLDTAAALLREAAAAGCELAVLPEYFCVLGRQDGDKLAVRETFGAGPVQDFLARQARTLGLWIVGGTLPLATDDPERVRNSSLAFAPDGRCVARYDKVHRFRFDSGSERYDETLRVEAGSAPVQFDVPARGGHTWRVGLSVCYDVRFPELYRAHAAAGCDLLLVPSAFTVPTGRAHWELLLRARAVENLAWLVAPAQGGTHANGRSTWGHSLITDPWGAVVAERTEEGVGLATATLDAARTAQLRRALPALDHRVL